MPGTSTVNLMIAVGVTAVPHFVRITRASVLTVKNLEYIMYAGRIIERGTLEDVFNHTKHPYTEGLFNSLPNIEDRIAKLQPIPGLMPDPTKLPKGCAFAPRCPYAKDECINTPQGALPFQFLLTSAKSA